MAVVYILYSKHIDGFYIGSCKNIAERLADHKNKTFKGYTAINAVDWELFLSIPDMEYSQARKIELHIKRMKSKKYILNLKLYSEMIEKLISKYK